MKRVYYTITETRGSVELPRSGYILVAPWEEGSNLLLRVAKAIKRRVGGRLLRCYRESGTSPPHYTAELLGVGAVTFRIEG